VATVKLYFEPYPENDANGLIIEESIDGVGSWNEIEDIVAVGTYPNWISSYTTTNATDVDYWFRIAWKVGGIPQGYSDPLQVDDLAPKYTTPDLIKERTRYAKLQNLDTVYIQEYIVQAYHMVQASCGAFDETDPDFIEIAPMAMRLYVEYLTVTQDPRNLSIFSGLIEEKIGSYKGRKSDRSDEILRTAIAEVPPNVSALLCRFSLDDSTPTETISTQVFPETPWYDGEQTDLDVKKIFTSNDSDQLAIDSVGYETRFGKYPSV